jgi:hypothetical protein
MARAGRSPLKKGEVVVLEPVHVSVRQIFTAGGT